jgi:DNA-binding transcriptional LysR family regulator
VATQCAGESRDRNSKQQRDPLTAGDVAMAMSGVTLIQLEILIAVVQAGSFSGASVELDCTQSRISHCISELERHLGERLFNRSRTGCSPTPYGQQVIAKARHILSLTDEITQISRTDEEIKGTVRVACIRSVATHVLPHVVEALAGRHPRIHMEILDNCHNYGKVVELVKQGLADIGITRVDEDEPEAGRPFISDPYIVVAPASMDLRSPACPEQLAELPFIAMQQPGSEWILEQCRAAGFAKGAVRQLSTESGVVAMVCRALGYTVLPWLTVYPDFFAAQTLPLPFPVRRKLTLLTCKASENRRQVRIAIDFIMNKQLLSNTSIWQANIIKIDF